MATTPAQAEWLHHQAGRAHRRRACVQVTSRTEQAQPAASHRYSSPDAGAAPPAPGWRARLRALLCCFRPDAGEYVRGEAEAVVIRPPQPPTPPQFSGEAVIGPLGVADAGRKTLVLDLDETLVHSSFKPIADPDYVIPVEIEGRVVDVYVLKRPWCDQFLAAVGPRFEVRPETSAFLICMRLGSNAVLRKERCSGKCLCALRRQRQPSPRASARVRVGVHDWLCCLCSPRLVPAPAGFTRDCKAHSPFVCRPGDCVHGQPGKVCGPAAGPAGQGARGALAPVPRGVLPVRGQLRQGPAVPGPPAGRQHHRRQLAALVRAWRRLP